MITRVLRSLLACYWGRHAQIVAVLARGVIAHGHRPEVIGFATAHAELHCKGIAAGPISTQLCKVSPVYGLV